MPEIKTKITNGGVLIQVVGLVLLFVAFPIGLVLGFIIIVLGGRVARQAICSECRNPLAGKQVKICPVCKAEFGKEIPMPAMSGGIVIDENLPSRDQGSR
jgi:hypothetical protein